MTPSAFAFVGRHQQRDRCAIRELRCIAGGDRASLGLERGRQLGEALERRVGPVALVHLDRDFLLRFLSGRLVLHEVGGRHREDLVIELAGLLAGRRALLGEQGVLVLLFAADLVALRDHFGGDAHRHVDRAQVLHQPGIEDVFLVPVVLQHGDRFGAAGHDDVGALVHDLVRAERDRLQTRRAEPVDRRARRGHRQPGQHRGVSRHVEALRSLRERAAENHVFDLGGVELRNLLQEVLDAHRREIVGPGQVEGAPERLGHGRAGAGDDYCFTHEVLLKW